MKYYKDLNNNVYAYEQDGSQDHLIDPLMTAITPTEMSQLLTPIKTDMDKQQDISDAIQKMLDDKAKSLRYDNIMSVRSYCGWANPFRSECEVVASWAASCWVIAGQIEQDVINGVRTIPSVEEVLLEMPIL